MKKLVILFSLLLIIFSTSGCGINKKPITAEEFKAKFEEIGYEVNDSSESFKSYPKYETAYTAIKDKTNIQFYKFKDTETAKRVFDIKKSNIMHSINSSYLAGTINFPNYTVYSAEYYGKFQVVSRVHDTLIVVDSNRANKDTINGTLIELGYTADLDAIFKHPLFIAICLIIPLIIIASLWKLFVKANVPGWCSLIPLYNLYLLVKITYGNGWKLLLILLPGINIICAILLSFRLAKVYGKSWLFGIGIIILWPLFLPILAFSKSKYIDYYNTTYCPSCGAIENGPDCCTNKQNNTE